MAQRILILGAAGQIGTELTEFLHNQGNNVLATDIKDPNYVNFPTEYEIVDVLDRDKLQQVISKFKPEVVYHMAAILSATGEKIPLKAWEINMQGLINVLELAREYRFKLFWPSSIAIFGPTTPKDNTPQHTIVEPLTIYGISKYAGERLIDYYKHRYGLDIRSLRYPGLISWKALPGGGTTDYAVEIFYEAIKNHRYTCYLDPYRTLPMMYMDDAIRGTVQLMEAPRDSIKEASYNFSAISFSPQELADQIKKHIPDFEINYEPDERDQLAQQWPRSIDDSRAREDWNWKHEYDLPLLVTAMLENIARKLNKQLT